MKGSESESGGESTEASSFGVSSADVGARLDTLSSKVAT